MRRRYSEFVKKGIVADIMGMAPEAVWASGKQPKIVQARSLLCYWANRELGVSQALLSRKLGLSQAAVSLSVNTAACAGCGTCAAERTFDAIIMNHFTDEQILEQSHALLETEPQEKILVFACNWCSYAGADYAGVARLQYPPNARLIRTMCSGRVDEKFIWDGFRMGAPVILVSGCHIGDCYYIDANHWTEKRVKKVHKKMAKLGIRPERLQLEWISATEGVRFAEVMTRMEALRQEVTPEEIDETIRVLTPE